MAHRLWSAVGLRMLPRRRLGACLEGCLSAAQGDRFKVLRSAGAFEYPADDGPNKFFTCVLRTTGPLAIMERKAMRDKHTSRVSTSRRGGEEHRASGSARDGKPGVSLLRGAPQRAGRLRPARAVCLYPTEAGGRGHLRKRYARAAHSPVCASTAGADGSDDRVGVRGDRC